MTVSLTNLIMKCATGIECEGIEFDADDVLACMYRDHREEVDKYAANMMRAELRRRISSLLKRRAGEDPTEDYEQLRLTGFENAPRNVPFYDGEKVRYIPAEAARKTHLLSAIKLRDDNITFCVERKKEYVKMLDLIEHHGGEITFGEARRLHFNEQAA
jgi:hypothetical protein